MKDAVNDFVLRQTKNSVKTYSYSLTFEQISKHAEERMLSGFYKDGYRNGIRIVEVDPKLNDQFFCPYVKVTNEIRLEANIVKRQDFEESYIQVRALNGAPLKAGAVELLLYRKDILLENKENTTDAEWELISINAIPEGVENLPMGYVTMMRNQLDLPGGTDAIYSSDEWAESVHFSQKYVAVKSG